MTKIFFSLVRVGRSRKTLKEKRDTFTEFQDEGIHTLHLNNQAIDIVIMEF